VTVPNLIGTGRDSAYSQLRGLGFNAPAHFPTPYGRSGPQDYSYPIVALVPGAGNCLNPGSTVKAISWAIDYCAIPRAQRDGSCFDLSGNPID
jgi:hypothetical protein